MTKSIFIATLAAVAALLLLIPAAVNWATVGLCLCFGILTYICGYLVCKVKLGRR